MENVEMSGEGKLLMYSSTILPAEKFSDMGKVAYGIIELKEGPIFITQIEEMPCSSAEEVKEGNSKLPIDVQAKIKEVAGMNIVVFEKK
ncbi:unnamed protein product [marine sediment metagenome]|uniref:DUF35 domain-containing protein n=1 Tax=marine sediment metagenome TaxID=412755 RepID=X0SLV4_9ZZZZ